MADDDKPNSKRVITKAAAMKHCSWAMEKIGDVICQSRSIEIELPPGTEAAEVASNLSGRLVGEVEREIIRNGLPVTVRIAIVKVGIGLMLPVQAVQGIPTQLAHVQTVEAVNTAKVTITANPSAAADEVIELAKAIKQTAPIQGESTIQSAKKIVSEASARFQVISEILSIYQLAESFANNTAADRQTELVRSACCQATRKAHRIAWQEAPKRFHTRSLKTSDIPIRFYGIKRSRRN